MIWKSQTRKIKLIVPSWMQVEIKEYNFDNYGIQKKITPGLKARCIVLP
jgi:hypothetical protein